MLSRPLLLLISVLAFSISAFSQGKMVFTEESFDFGNVTEGTQATHEFQFVNKGNEAIIISNVQASCGCTTPFWTKQPIAPGSKGTIKASFNSQGRPGIFTKSITVTSNAEVPSKILTIRGTVVDKPLVSPSSKAQFESTVFDLGKTYRGKKLIKSITVTNAGNTILSINGVKSNCNCILTEELPSAIKPGESAVVQLGYVPKQLGLFNEPILFSTNDKNNPDVKIYLKSEVLEDNSLNSVVKESKSSIPFN